MASFTAAAASADWAGAKNFAVSLVDQAGATSWPIVSATFLLLPEDPKDPARAANVAKFITWAYQNGAQIATSLDYIPLPKSVQDIVLAKIKSDVKS
jgi:phosphate transport system substrate-binding protein